MLDSRYNFIYAFASDNYILHNFVYLFYNTNVLHLCLLQQEIDGSNPAGKWIDHGDVCLQQSAARLYVADSTTRHKVTIHLAWPSIRAEQLNDSKSHCCHSGLDSGLKSRMFIYGSSINQVHTS